MSNFVSGSNHCSKSRNGGNEEVFATVRDDELGRGEALRHIVGVETIRRARRRLTNDGVNTRSRRLAEWESV